jgi:hypothetical protein
VYKQIDIKVSPKFITGTLIEKSICSCGENALNSDVEIGREYNCEINSVRWARWTCYGCGKVTDVRLIDVYSDTPFIPIQWFLLDLLDIGAGIDEAKKPEGWIAVKDNQVSPPVKSSVRTRIVN